MFWDRAILSLLTFTPFRDFLIFFIFCWLRLSFFFGVNRKLIKISGSFFERKKISIIMFAPYKKVEITKLLVTPLRDRNDEKTFFCVFILLRTRSKYHKSYKTVKHPSRVTRGVKPSVTVAWRRVMGVEMLKKREVLFHNPLQKATSLFFLIVFAVPLVSINIG